MSAKYLSCAETAKLLRASLKAAHPGVKFSVRSHTYAGGASIDVGWTDGPTEDAVKATTGLYSGATFDGMIDLKSYHSSLVATDDGTVQEVHFGADFIFTHRDLSAELIGSYVGGIVDAGRVGSTPEQCRHCGTWMVANSNCYVSRSLTYGGSESIDFVCSPQCGAKREARFGLDPITQTDEPVPPVAFSGDFLND